MNKFIYTYWDNLLGLRHGSFNALSVDDADELAKRFSDSVEVGLWKKSEDVSAKSFCWPTLNMYYLQRRKPDKLSCAFPATNIIPRIVFSLLLIPMLFIEQSLIFSLMCISLVLLTFIYSRKIIISRDFVTYEKRLFLKTESKRINISNATKVLFKGIKFISFSDKTETGYFIYLEKDRQKITVFGATGVNMRSITKLANKIGNFLELPVEEGSNQI